MEEVIVEGKPLQVRHGNALKTQAVLRDARDSELPQAGQAGQCPGWLRTPFPAEAPALLSQILGPIVQLPSLLDEDQNQLPEVPEPVPRWVTHHPLRHSKPVRDSEGEALEPSRQLLQQLLSKGHVQAVHEVQ